MHGVKLSLTNAQMLLRFAETADRPLVKTGAMLVGMSYLCTRLY